MDSLKWSKWSKIATKDLVQNMAIDAMKIVIGQHMICSKHGCEVQMSLDERKDFSTTPKSLTLVGKRSFITNLTTRTTTKILRVIAKEDKSVSTVKIS